MKKFSPFVLLILMIWFQPFGFAEAPSLEAQAFHQKLYWIEQKIVAIQEIQKQMTEKQAQIKEELDSLRVLINRFR
jgi:hypothetical protein